MLPVDILARLQLLAKRPAYPSLADRLSFHSFEPKGQINRPRHRDAIPSSPASEPSRSNQQVTCAIAMRSQNV